MKLSRPEPRQPIPPHAKKVFSGVLFDVYQWEQELFDGTKATFEKLSRPDTVVVFPVLPDGRILLLSQEQPGGAPFMSAAGGRVERGEEALAAAARELREETGYEADAFFLWDARQPAGKIDWAVYTFVAKGLRRVGDPVLDGGEKIEPRPVTFEELLEVGTNMRFSEREIAERLLEAKYDPEKRAALRELFDPSILDGALE